MVGEKKFPWKFVAAGAVGLLAYAFTGAAVKGVVKMTSGKKKAWNEFTETERKAMLLPEVLRFCNKIVDWAKARGYNVTVGETYRDMGDQLANFEAGRTQASGLHWHQMGRAFHLIITKSVNGKRVLDMDAYPVVGAEVRRLGGQWLGDIPLKNKYGKVFYDTAHFELHPGLNITSYRNTATAMNEAKRATQLYQAVA